MGTGLVITESGKIEYQLEEDRTLAAIEVRVRTTYSGISAVTELTAYRGSNPYLHKLWITADKKLFTDYGLYRGDFALSLFKDRVAEKLGLENATFQNLQEGGGMDLRVFATNLNVKHVQEFSARKTSDVPLAAAVRASMSVPPFFTAVEINGQIFVNGGAVLDYPLQAFGKDGISNTLSLAFSGS